MAQGPVTTARKGGGGRGRGAWAWMAALLVAALAAFYFFTLPDADGESGQETPAPEPAGTALERPGGGAQAPQAVDAPSRHGGRVIRLRMPPDFPVSGTPGGLPGDGPVGGASPESAAPLAAAEREQARSSREPAIFDVLRHSKGKPIPKEVRDLAEEVTKDATNAVSRTRAIYDWITSNIRYDAEEWANLTSGADDYAHDHSPAAVLERGTTVCIGYAWLFDAMCESVGVEATYVIGDVRGYRGTPDDALVSAFRHAWNAVKTDDGNWELLDATWGAVQEGENPDEAKPRADYYYATPASQFIYDHFPEEASWQLLDEPIPDEETFRNLPNLKPSFFQNGVELGAPYTSALRARAGTDSAMALSVPRGVHVAATLSLPDGSKTTRVRTFAAEDGRTAVVIPAQGRGEYLLRVYSRKAGDPVFTCSADFAIRVE